MDQNGVLVNPDPSKDKHRHLLIRRTLQFLVPASLASFLLSYISSRFSFLFTHIFRHSLTFLFPLLARAFERKYMFLICNCILAFLVKTLKLSNDNSSLSVSETIHDAEFNGEPVSADSSPDQNGALHGIKAPPVAGEEEQGYFQVVPEEAALAVVELRGKPKVPSAVEKEGRQLGDFIIECEELEMTSEVDDGEEDMEEGGRTLAEQEVDAYMDTEELNKRVEQFIKKMKEDIRIQARQQLIAAAV